MYTHIQLKPGEDGIDFKYDFPTLWLAHCWFLFPNKLCFLFVWLHYDDAISRIAIEKLFERWTLLVLSYTILPVHYLILKWIPVEQFFTTKVELFTVDFCPQCHFRRHARHVVLSLRRLPLPMSYCRLGKTHCYACRSIVQVEHHRAFSLTLRFLMHVRHLFHERSKALDYL